MAVYIQWLMELVSFNITELIYSANSFTSLVDILQIFLIFFLHSWKTIIRLISLSRIYNKLKNIYILVNYI